MTWERKILMKIYGPKCEQGVWRMNNNLELQNAYKPPDIATGMAGACQNGRHG
jgi:hypothetical protein